MQAGEETLQPSWHPLSTLKSLMGEMALTLSQLDQSEAESLDEAASGDPAVAEALLASQRHDRRASSQQASASGRRERAPDDAAFKHFDSLVDDWLVRHIPATLVLLMDDTQPCQAVCMQPGASCRKSFLQAP